MHTSLRFVAALTILLCGCDGGPQHARGDGGVPDGGVPDVVDGNWLPDAEPPTAVAFFELTVVDGVGSGTYALGDTVHIFSNLDPYESVLTGWTSSTGENLPPEWHFIFTMPATSVTLTPQVVDVAMELEERLVPGVAEPKRIIFAVPPEPRGVLFIFHGTGGSANVIDKPAMHYVARLAFERGYAVIATDAEEVTLGDPGPDGKLRWNATGIVETNIDLQNIELLSEMMSTQMGVPVDAPRFAVGMSNGGAFSVAVGAALPFTAVTSFCSTGRTPVWNATETPTQWLMCSNDSNAEVAAKRDMWRDGTENLAARSIPTDYDELLPSPVYDSRFTRLSGVDATASAALTAELHDHGALDDRGFLLITPEALLEMVLSDRADWPALGEVIAASSAGHLLNELKHAHADHAMYDDWAARTLAFFEDQLR